MSLCDVVNPVYYYLIIIYIECFKEEMMWINFCGVILMANKTLSILYIKISYHMLDTRHITQCCSSTTDNKLFVQTVLLKL